MGARDDARTANSSDWNARRPRTKNSAAHLRARADRRHVEAQDARRRRSQREFAPGRRVRLRGGAGGVRVRRARRAGLVMGDETDNAVATDEGGETRVGAIGVVHVRERRLRARRPRSRVERCVRRTRRTARVLATERWPCDVCGVIRGDLGERGVARDAMTGVFYGGEDLSDRRETKKDQ